MVGKITLAAIAIEFIVFNFFLKDKKEILLRSVLTNYIGIVINKSFTAWVVNNYLFVVWNSVFLSQYAIFNTGTDINAIDFIFLCGVALLIHEFYWYVIHFLNHKYDFLWSFHQFHHSSRFLNYSVAVRVPALLFFQGYVGTAILAVLGFPLEVFLVVINFNLIYGLWTHSDYWPEMPFLRRFLITPMDHAKHHERNAVQQNSNFGSILSIYDHLFKTYSWKKCSYVYGVECSYNAETFFEAQLVPVYQYFKSKIGLLLSRPKSNY